MDYNSYLMGVYGARHENGHVAAYMDIAKEMEFLHNAKSSGFWPIPVRHIAVGGGRISMGIKDGAWVREIALKHLEEIWPGFND